MLTTVRKGAMWGAAFGIALLLAIVAWVGFGVPGARGEAFALGLTAALFAGFPLSLLVSGLATATHDSQLFPVLYAVLLASVVINWSLVGAAIGWIVGAWRTRSTESG